MKPLKDYSEQLLDIAESRMRLSVKYAKERKEYGERKAAIDLLLSAELLSMMEKRKTLGYETATLMLISQKPELGPTYKEMITHHNNYKAIERMLDAHDSKAMAIQSVMKYNKTNDGGI